MKINALDCPPIPLPIQFHDDFQKHVEDALHIYEKNNPSFIFPKSNSFFQNLKTQILEGNIEEKQKGLIKLANVVFEFNCYNEAYYLYYMAASFGDSRQALLHLARLLFLEVVHPCDIKNPRVESRKIFDYLVKKYGDVDATCYLDECLYSN